MRIPVKILALSAMLMVWCCGGDPDDGCVSGYGVSLTWEFIGNHASPDRSEASFTIKNIGNKILKDDNWKLYFNQMGPDFLNESLEEKVAFGHVNGDLMVVYPTDGFRLNPGEEIRITYEKSGMTLKVVEAPAAPYLVVACKSTTKEIPVAVGHYEILPFPPLENVYPPESGIPLPGAEWVYGLNEGLLLLDRGDNPGIIPGPEHLAFGEGFLQLDGGWIISCSGDAGNEAAYLAGMLGDVLGKRPRIVEGGKEGPGVIRLAVEDLSGFSREAYTLEATEAAGISIMAAHPAGIFYGIQSLLSMVPAENWQNPHSSVKIKSVNIIDSPSFEYRGMMLDVARNFHDAQSVKKLMDVMAHYKLNRLHLSLTNDEGWRIEIPGLPELTGVGGFRGHTLTSKDHLLPAYGSGPFPDTAAGMGSGYYSREQFIDLLCYALERHIQVVPEINFPGHARAAIFAMEARYDRFMAEGREADAERYRLIDPRDRSRYNSAQHFHDNVVCVCKEAPFLFFERVVDALSDMYREAGTELTLLHTGGDEVPAGAWTGSPMCRSFLNARKNGGTEADLQEYFGGRILTLLTEKGIRMAGWEEVALRKDNTGTWKPNPDYSGSGMVPYVWNSLGTAIDLGNRLANAGYPVVLCNVDNFYFDLAYSHHPDEPGLYWGGYVDTRRAFEFAPYHVFHTTLTDRYRRPFAQENKFEGREELDAGSRDHILGLQAQLWSETLRNSEMLEYYYLPKMLALAERAWVGQASWGYMKEREERLLAMGEDWNRFANLIGQQELPKLDALFGGYCYRIPPPGGVISEGMLYANTAFPGLLIRYTTDGSVPDSGSPLYSTPVPIQGAARLRSFSSLGREGRVSEVRYEK